MTIGADSLRSRADLPAGRQESREAKRDCKSRLLRFIRGLITARLSRSGSKSETVFHRLLYMILLEIKKFVCYPVYSYAH